MAIQFLPDHIIHQIAAAEVVQRPASVVKELLENAIDAGSKHVTVIFRQGGMELIHVIDDGEGMNEADAVLCWERHATSKLPWKAYPAARQSDALYGIVTLGFRGEALPSIAAVSQTELITRTAESQVGVHLYLEGGKLEKKQPVAAAQGTQVKVKNLFFNTPARRQFLKSPAAEARHLTEEFQRVALAYPEVGFVLRQDDKVVYDLPASKLAVRIVRLFGEAYQERIIPCEEKNQVVQAEGYIGTPATARKSGSEQFFFINRRFIKAPLLAAAVRRAFEGLIPEHSHPLCILNLTMAPQDVDLHVHPAKTAVKFSDEQFICTVLQAAVRKALATHHMLPSIDFSQHVNRFPYDLGQRATVPASAKERDYMQLRAICQEQAGYAPTGQPASPAEEEAKKEAFIPTVTAGSDVTVPAMPPTHPPFSPLPAPGNEADSGLLLLHQRYLLRPAEGGLLLMDVQHAQERVLYERYQRRLKHNTKALQKSLFPEKITLSQPDFLLLEGAREAVEALGFKLELMPPDAVRITAQPPETMPFSPQSFLESWLAIFRETGDPSAGGQDSVWLGTLVKRIASQAGSLSQAEQQQLAQQLFSCANPNYTPDGKRIWQLVSIETLERLLG